MLVQWSPLVWSTDVRSTRLYGQFLVGPKQNGHSVSVKARLKVKNARLYGQNLGQKVFLNEFGVLWKVKFGLNVIPSSLSSNSEHMPPRYSSKFDFLKKFWIEFVRHWDPFQ